MSPSNQLTREELLEMAELEMLGGLDEYEQTFFHRAMLNAPSAVQEEIRNLQASIAADPSLLLEDGPDDALKLSTLAAVAHAIDEENEQLAPLATIGSGQRHGVGLVAAGSGGSAHVYLWRAATFALAAGLLVSLFFMGKVVETNRELASTLGNVEAADAIVKAGGVDIRDMFVRQHVARALPATLDPLHGREREACGVLLIDDQRQVAVVFLQGLLPSDIGEYRILATDAENRKHDLGKVVKSPGQTTATSVLAQVGKILPSVATLAAVKIEIVAADGTVIMATV